MCKGSARMKKYLKYWKYVVIFLVCLISIVSFLLYPHLELKDGNIEIDVNTKYKDPGYRAYNILSSFTKKVKVEGKVNPKKVGTYKIKYSYKGIIKKVSKTRAVKVVDKIAPKITLEEEPEEICKNKYKDYKYKAEDNYDGDLTKKVEVELQDDKLIYTVVDSSGNDTVLTRKVKIITDNKPELKLKGSKEMTVYKGTEYKEPGYEAKDKCDGDLTEKVKVEGSVDKSKNGTYEIKYSVFNSNEVKETVTRKVYVKDKPAITGASASNGSGKTVYLTFDDGPGPYTVQILNTLDKYGVKATFFVTNQFPAYQYLISEEAKRGHAIAVHTYTHNYNVYTSVDTYVNDFNKMNEVIKNRTGSYSTMFRFPGGSSNTISRKYSNGVVSAIAREMTEKGYVYYDWNVSSGDAAGYNSTGIYNATVNGVSRCGAHCVVLMHDIKLSTANALDSILSELKSKGYSFGVLTPSGPTAHHKIAN